MLLLNEKQVYYVLYIVVLQIKWAEMNQKTITADNFLAVNIHGDEKFVLSNILIKRADAM